MNCLGNRRLTAAEKRIVQRAVRQETVEAVRKYEQMFDICFIYALVDQLGFGPKRAKRLYKRYFEVRDEVQQDVLSTTDDGVREAMMAATLKTHGIDVAKWYEEFGQTRLNYSFSK